MTQDSDANQLSTTLTTWRNRPATKIERTLRDGKTIVTGMVTTDETHTLFLRKVLGAGHFVQNEDAIAIDEATLDLAANLGAVYVLAESSDSRQRWRQDVEVIRRLGWTENRSTAGWQVYLRREHWNRSADQLAAGWHRQGSLFAGARD